jgi:multiple sugar transport system ATP-binding protein
VTHDQIEAMTMGDRIAVMRDGILLQCDTPLALYDNPMNAYVAEFIGSPPMNLLRARVEHDWAVVGDVDVIEIPLARAAVAQLSSAEVIVGFRPDTVQLTAPGQGLYAHVEAVENLGYVAYAHCVTGVGEGRRRTIIVRCEPYSAPRPGSAVGLQVDRGAIRFFEPSTGRRLTAAAA